MDDVWVVFECKIGNEQHFWAWCRPNRDSPGFDQIFYTQRDGITAMSPMGDLLPALGTHLFTVVFPGQEVASNGGTFLPAAGLAPDASWRPAPPTLAPADTGGE